jgi:hypothetical protein
MASTATRSPPANGEALETATARFRVSRMNQRIPSDAVRVGKNGNVAVAMLQRQVALSIYRGHLKFEWACGFALDARITCTNTPSLSSTRCFAWVGKCRREGGLVGKNLIAVYLRPLSYPCLPSPLHQPPTRHVNLTHSHRLSLPKLQSVTPSCDCQRR